MVKIYTLILITVFLFVGFLYHNTYKEYILKVKSEEIDLDQFFFKDISHLSNKRKIWIHLPSEKNHRNWRQIRGSYDLNLDYIALCIKSIIDYCGQYYDVILLDDSNFSALLKVDIDPKKLSGELLATYRQHCLLNILYQYGGIVLPCSFYMRKSIYSVDKPNTFYVCEIPNQGLHADHSLYSYSTRLMGSNAGNPIVAKCMTTLDIHTETKMFSEPWLKKMDIPRLSCKAIGGCDIKGEPIYLEDLMGNRPLELDPSHVGIVIPHEELMRRPKYNWYAHLSAEQVLEADVFISKYMLEHGKPKI